VASKNYISGRNSGEWGWIRYVKKHSGACVARRSYGSKGVWDVFWTDRKGNVFFDQVKYSNKKSKTKIPYISKDEINRLKDFAHNFIEAKNVHVRYVRKKAYKKPIIVNL